MTLMSKDETKTFLKQGTFTGKLATVSKDGSPHVVPIWFILDNEDNIIFETFDTSVKGKNILRDSRVSLSVDDQKFPYSFVTIFGRAEILKSYDNKEGSNEFLQWAKEISARYVGQKKADVYAKRNSSEGAVLFRIIPKKIIAEKNIAN